MMIATMFTNKKGGKPFQQQPQQKRENVYKTNHHLQVLTAAELLAGRHQKLIETAYQASGLPSEYIVSLYDVLINNFAEFVQVLPTEVNGALSGLLSLSMIRATVVLQKFVAEQGRNIDPLMNYALYSAALLMDVQKAITNHRIMITDEEGAVIDEWRPFEASLAEAGAGYYKLFPSNGIYKRLSDSIRPLLARQLMPESGFLWIANDPHVFADWLDALNGDTIRGSRLTHFLSLFKLEDLLAMLAEFPQIPVDMLESTANQHGEAFHQWLKNGIENGDLKVNTADASIHVVTEGVLLEKQLFKQFTDVYNAPVNMTVVYAQFGNLLGITKKGGLDFISDQYFSGHAAANEVNAVAKGNGFASPLAGVQRSMREGMVVKDSSAVFARSNAPATSTKMKSVQSQGVPSYHQLPPSAGVKNAITFGNTHSHSG